MSPSARPPEAGLASPAGGPARSAEGAAVSPSARPPEAGLASPAGGPARSAEGVS